MPDQTRTPNGGGPNGASTRNGLYSVSERLFMDYGNGSNRLYGYCGSHLTDTRSRPPGGADGRASGRMFGGLNFVLCRHIERQRTAIRTAAGNGRRGKGETRQSHKTQNQNRSHNKTPLVRKWKNQFRLTNDDYAASNNAKSFKKIGPRNSIHFDQSIFPTSFFPVRRSICRRAILSDIDHSHRRSFASRLSIFANCFTDNRPFTASRKFMALPFQSKV